jgi:hypothetical protein
MPSDAGTSAPRPSPSDLWRLPRIVKLRIERVRYTRPRRHVQAGRIVEIPEGVEIFVETAAEVPIRALSPALYIGTTEVAENERVGERQYRFFVLDESSLGDGSPIALGWAGVPGRRVRTSFRYRAPSDRAKPKGRRPQ